MLPILLISKMLSFLFFHLQLCFGFLSQGPKPGTYQQLSAAWLTLGHVPGQESCSPTFSEKESGQGRTQVSAELEGPAWAARLPVLGSAGVHFLILSRHGIRWSLSELCCTILLDKIFYYRISIVLQ